MLKALDTALINAAQKAYLKLLDNFFLTKGCVLIALGGVSTIIVMHYTLHSILFTLLCNIPYLLFCLQMDDNQRKGYLARVNSFAMFYTSTIWRPLTLLIILSGIPYSIYLTINEGRWPYIISDMCYFTSLYLLCAKVREPEPKSKHVLNAATGAA